MAYCTRDDVEQIFGVNNIAKWADADNTRTAGDITARIAFMIEDTQAMIDARLAVRYTTPFTTVPVLIKNLTARLTGIALYEFPRGIADGAESSDFSNMKDNCYETLDKILNDQLLLTGQTPTATSAPKAVELENRSEVE